MNSSFSKRHGYQKVGSSLQVESMNDELKISLWNVCYDHMVKIFNPRSEKAIDHTQICRIIWKDFLKYPLNEFDDQFFYRSKDVINNSYFTFPWNRVYDFIEFIIEITEYNVLKTKFIRNCNKVLKRESAGYLIVDEFVTPITNQNEVNEIEKEINNPIAPVSKHIRDALLQLTRKENPDYKNSIKESISAVESLCKLITKKKTATLGKALKEIENSGLIIIPNAVNQAFQKFYGYTSDKDGIRHGMIEMTNVDLEDARFMLITCSAFVNYLIEKSNKAGITF